ncbi:MAG TPA: PQQ-binding-like beta-propeller repeat protein [Ktedonobacterales bacterium]
MTLRELMLGFGALMLALGALALWRAIRRLVKRRRAGRGWFWGGLVIRVIVIMALLWSGVATLQHLPAPPFANHDAPAASDAIVVIHTEDTSHISDIRTGGLEGVSARDGSVRWRLALPQFVDAVTPGPPGVVFAIGAGAGAGPASALYAVRMADGSLLWSRANAGKTVYSYYPHSVILTDGAQVYALVQTGSGLALQALSARGGATLWSAPLPDDSIGSVTSLALAGGMIFAASDSQTNIWIVTAWRVRDGARLWRLAAPSSTTVRVGDRQPVIAAAGSLVYLAVNETQVLALDARTGERIWSARPSPLASDPLTPQAALATSGALYLAGQLQQAEPAPSGPNALPGAEALYRLVALNPSSGALRWSARLALTPSALTVNDGVLIASGQDGALETFDTASGARLWNSESSLENATPWRVAFQEYAPLAISGAVFVMDSEVAPGAGLCFLNCPGVIWLYAAGPRDGTLWWRVRLGPVSLVHWTL